VRRALFATAAGLAAFAAGCARAEPPMWVVKDRNSELVLFGSVHVLPAGLAWRPAALDRALSGADDVWFELPTGPEAEQESARTALNHGLLPQGQRLSKLLRPADAERLARVAQAYGIDPAMLEAYRPWMAEMALAGAVFRRAAASEANGVEAVLSAATPPATPRRSFETPSEQIAFFAGAPLGDQIAALNQTVREMEHDPDEFQLLLRAWMAGDVRTIERESLDPMRRAAPNLFRVLVVERNRRWAATLDRRLKGQGRSVVIVGLGHLVGPEGLPARLRALGYSVEGP
jgi:uncharacterized protein YbaP (TraB family)